LLLACLERRPATEIAALAASLPVPDDPETTYVAADHLAYCGQTTAALEMLTRAVQGGYCAVPAMESDRLLVRVRTMPGFAAVRALGIACRERFRVERARAP
jgi:hypothetical protein